VVPENLESHGVPLHLWQKWSDCVNNMWTNRIANFVTKQSRSKWTFLIFDFFLKLCCYSFVLSIILVITPGNEYEWKRLLSIILYMSTTVSSKIAFVLFFPLACLNFCFINRAFYAAEECIENSWSDLVLDLNDGECQEFGLRVKAVRYTMQLYGSAKINVQNTKYRTHDMTVGFQFYERAGTDLHEMALLSLLQVYIEIHQFEQYWNAISYMKPLNNLIHRHTLLLTYVNLCFNHHDMLKVPSYIFIQFSHIQ
jgi:hypothetical protein